MRRWGRDVWLAGSGGDLAPSRRTVARGIAPGFARDPVLVVLMALSAMIAAGYGADWGSVRLQITVHWFTMGGLHLGLAVMASRVVRQRPAVPRNVSRVWAAATAAGVCYTVGDVVQLGLLTGGRLDAEALFGGPWQSIAVLAGTIVFVGALVTTPAGWRTRQRRIQYWLDVVIVLMTATTFGGYSFAAGPAGPVTVALGLLTGPGLFVVGVFAIVRATLAQVPPMTRAAGAAVGVAASVEAVTQAISQLLVDHDRLSWQKGLTLLASTVLAAGARIQQLQSGDRWSASGRAGGPPDPPRGRSSVLPYLAIVSTNILQVVVLATRRLDGHAWVVVVGTIISTGLVVARQLLAFADNRRLVQTLDTTVSHLRVTMRERDQLTTQLHHKAYHDALTGLPNRASFGDRLGTVCGGPEAGPVAVMVVDLDDFKPVNDTYGHAVGDQVLIEVAVRMQRCAGSGDMVARIGGDEFGVLVQQAGADLDQLARRVLTALSCPIVITPVTVSISASVGIAVTRHALDAQQLLVDADQAMYAAKYSTKGTYRVAHLVRSGLSRRAQDSAAE